jgi:hypothetical protein
MNPSFVRSMRARSNTQKTAGKLIDELGVKGAVEALASAATEDARRLDAAGKTEAAGAMREAASVYRTAARRLTGVTRRGWSSILGGGQEYLRRDRQVRMGRRGATTGSRHSRDETRQRQWGGSYRSRANATREAARHFPSDVQWRVIPKGRYFVVMYDVRKTT